MISGCPRLPNRARLIVSRPPVRREKSHLISGLVVLSCSVWNRSNDAAAAGVVAGRASVNAGTSARASAGPE